MKTNMGVTDKLVRLVISAAIIFLWALNIVTGTLAIVLLGAALIFIITSIAGNCPLYSVFGINTCPSKKNQG